MSKNKLYFSTQNLLVAVVFISIFTMAVRIPFAPDTWWHIRTGQYIVENVTIPTTDPFSHTKAGELWIDHGWLAQIFWYGLYAVGGWGMVSLGVAALVTIAFWFVWKQIEANIFVVAFIMILGTVTSAVVWIARPQMVSFTLTAIVAYLLHRFKRGEGKLLPWMPIVMIFWANIHGGFAIGFMVMVAYLMGEVVNHITGHQDDPVISWSGLKHLVIVMGISLAVVAINPHGWQMWFYPFRTVGIGALRDFIAEWQSPDFHDLFVQPFVVMLLLVIAALARSGRRADWTDLALIAMWTIWSLFAGRNIAIFALVATPVLARYADEAWTLQWQDWGYTTPPFSHAGHKPRGYISRTQRLKSTVNWILLSVIIIAALIKIALPLNPETIQKVEQDSLPSAAVDFLEQEQLPGPIFNSYNWGGYLIFRLWPDYPVYIDGRTDLYDDQFIRRYLSVTAAGEEWQQILDEEGINLIFIETGSSLAKFLRLESDWVERYQDDQAAIFTRTE